MAKPLSGKVALVTGASRGIGAAIARRLADDGADIAISYTASSGKAEAVVADLKSKGVRAEAFKADQADVKAAARLIDDVAAKFGRLDILVNNAGVFVGGDASEEEFDRQFRVNVASVAAAVRAAAKHLPEGGRIVTIGSNLGALVPFSGLADYSATKAAVAGYTKGWARDFGPKAITVNVVQPGPVTTDMNPGEGEFGDLQRSRTALGRYGRPEEIAAAVAFLAGPEAGFITGAALTVDGGFNA
ncbi:MAG: SDR family oxidoreductase [Amphiplicatus sp.]